MPYTEHSHTATAHIGWVDLKTSTTPQALVSGRQNRVIGIDQSST